jgi:thymidylate synthase (FAD)
MSFDSLDKLAELDEELGLFDFGPPTNTIRVALIDHMGSDDTVVDAARVSFSKRREHYNAALNVKLIKYLAKHNHWSPFAHPMMSYRIQAPIFVARQLAKHQIGLAWNEVSRRYIKTRPRVWMPSGFRKASDSVKQGSSEELVPNERLIQDYRYAVELAMRTYDSLIAEGVCPEMARAVLPQGMVTEWVWSGSLYAFSRVVKLRTTEYAQRETKGVATEIAKYCAELFPVSWEALMEN